MSLVWFRMKAQSNRSLGVLQPSSGNACPIPTAHRLNLAKRDNSGSPASYLGLRVPHFGTSLMHTHPAASRRDNRLGGTRILGSWVKMQLYDMQPVHMAPLVP